METNTKQLEMKSTREAYGEVLVELGKKSEKKTKEAITKKEHGK